MVRKNFTAKKEAEHLDIEDFLRLYPGAPEGILISSEQPDFIFKTPGWNIGIEHSRLTDEALMKINNFNLAFHKKLRQSLAVLIPFNFVIDVRLNSIISSKTKNELIKFIVSFCIGECAYISEGESYEFHNIELPAADDSRCTVSILKRNGFHPMPSEIDSIRFDRIHWDGDVFLGGGRVIYPLTESLLLPRLRQKELLLINYQLCTEHWLVFCESGGIENLYSNIEVTGKVESTFDKVFILRSHKNEVVIIKT